MLYAKKTINKTSINREERYRIYEIAINVDQDGNTEPVRNIFDLLEDELIFFQNFPLCLFLVIIFLLFQKQSFSIAKINSAKYIYIID